MILGSCGSIDQTKSLRGILTKECPRLSKQKSSFGQKERGCNQMDSETGEGGVSLRGKESGL